MEKQYNINMKVSEPTEKILNDIFGIYKENYPELGDEEIWGYFVEDMLESYLEGVEQEEGEDTEEDDSEDENNS